MQINLIDICRITLCNPECAFGLNVPSHLWLFSSRDSEEPICLEADGFCLENYLEAFCVFQKGGVEPLKYLFPL